MNTFDRRSFLKFTQRAAAGVSLLPLINWTEVVNARSGGSAGPTAATCWLEVCAPFVVEDPVKGIHSELVLTSDTFVGRNGHEDQKDSTEYEILLYEMNGRAIGPDGVAKKLTVPALHTTSIRIKDLIGELPSFSGGMKVRLRPKTRKTMHASDLFSSAFLRISTNDSFDNVHANPDPIQWQQPISFFYSMPFPPLREYDCVFGLFNPNHETSSGTVTVYGATGETLRAESYELKPHRSQFIDLRSGETLENGLKAFGRYPNQNSKKLLTADGGTIAVLNDEGKAKCFAYLVVKHPQRPRFSIDHPIHQSPFRPTVSKEAFGANGKFRPKNILYTPLVFKSKKLGGITFNSRFHLSSGAPLEENLWLLPFVTNGEGEVVWQVGTDGSFLHGLAKQQVERGTIRLGRHQSCLLDCIATSLPVDFSGGLSLAVRANTNHTLMKVELKVPEWGAHAFSHFRPGIFSARGYQKAEPRDGLATDYIASGARLHRRNGNVMIDELIAIMNIDDKGVAGDPVLEIFSVNGLAGRVELGTIPAFAGKHFLISELVKPDVPNSDLTFRLVDNNATLVMSVVHISYKLKDIAIDHGSDRFSTFSDFGCEIER